MELTELQLAKVDRPLGDRIRITAIVDLAPGEQPQFEMENSPESTLVQFAKAVYSAACRACPVGCPSCAESDCECYLHQAAHPDAARQVVIELAKEHKRNGRLAEAMNLISMFNRDVRLNWGNKILQDKILQEEINLHPAEAIAVKVDAPAGVLAAVQGEATGANRNNCAFCGRERTIKDDNHGPDCAYWTIGPGSL